MRSAVSFPGLLKPWSHNVPNPEVVPPNPPEVIQPEKQVDAPSVDPKPLPPNPTEPEDTPPVAPENAPLEERDA